MSKDDIGLRKNLDAYTIKFESVEERADAFRYLSDNDLDYEFPDDPLTLVVSKKTAEALKMAKYDFEKAV
jgi:hypothetical protein